MFQIVNYTSRLHIDKSKKDTIATIENRVNKHLKELLKKELIDNSTYDLKAKGL